MRVVERAPDRTCGGGTVLLEPDVAIEFPSSEAVIEALRQIIGSGQQS